MGTLYWMYNGKLECEPRPKERPLARAQQLSRLMATTVYTQSYRKTWLVAHDIWRKADVLGIEIPDEIKLAAMLEQ